MNTMTIFRASSETRRKWLRALNYPREFDDPEDVKDRRYRQFSTFENELFWRLDHYDKIRKELP